MAANITECIVDPCPLDPRALQQAGAAARRFLRRWRDCFTKSAREDLAQEAVVEAWCRAATIRDPARLDSFVRTIARRRRWQSLRLRARLSVQSFDGDPELGELLVAPTVDAVAVRVAGRAVDRDWLVQQLSAVLAAVKGPNGQILRSFYEGFSCAELAWRFGLSEEAVKLRMHRTRRRVRRELEIRVRRDGRGALRGCSSNERRK